MTQQWTREQIMQGLQEIVTEITFMKTSEEYDGEEGGIWTNGEDIWMYKGIPVFNHNLEYGELLLSDNGDTDPKHMGMKVKEMYLCGIHREIYSWLEERGWHPEWLDPGTLFFWVNSDEHEADILEDVANHPEGDENSIDVEMLHLLRKKFSDEGKENNE